VTGRPRGVCQERQIVGIALVDLGFDISGMGGSEVKAGSLDLIEWL